MKKLIFIALLLSFNAFADDATPENSKSIGSSLNLFLTGDSYDGRGGGLDLDLGLKRGRLLLGLSGSRSDKDQAREDRVKNFYAGVGSNPANRHYFNFTYEFWGVRDQFESRSLNPSFNLRNENRRWTLNISPGFRRIKIFTDPTVTTKEDYTVSNPYLTIGLNFLGPRNFTFKLEGSRNWYNANLDELKNYDTAYIFSPTTLSLSDSLQTSRITLGVGYIFSAAQVSIEGTRSQSEIDDIIARTLAIRSVFFVQENLDLGLTVGGTKTSEQIDDDDTNRFLELNMAYYW